VGVGVTGLVSLGLGLGVVVIIITWNNGITNV
jgi:hypothetical protein